MCRQCGHKNRGQCSGLTAKQQCKKNWHQNQVMTWSVRQLLHITIDITVPLLLVVELLCTFSIYGFFEYYVVCHQWTSSVIMFKFKTQYFCLLHTSFQTLGICSSKTGSIVSINILSNSFLVDGKRPTNLKFWVNFRFLPDLDSMMDLLSSKKQEMPRHCEKFYNYVRWIKHFLGKCHWHSLRLPSNPETFYSLIFILTSFST